LPKADVAAEDAAKVAFVAKPSASSPLVTVSFLVHTGAAFDPEGKKGLAVLTASMLTDGGSQAKTIDELGLRPLTLGQRLLRARDYKPRAMKALIEAKIILATEDGRLYISEENLAKIETRK